MSSAIYNGNKSDDNCTNVDTLMKRYYLPVMYSIIFVVGLLGNVTSIAIYLIKLRPWKSSSIIMFNLALTDLLYVLSLPFMVYYYTNGESWTLGDFMCRFLRFGFHFNLYGSILFLTCLAVFRYVVAAHPLRAAQVQQRRWGILACAVVWAIAVAEIVPMLTMITMETKNNKTHCLDFASGDPAVLWWYGWLLTVLGYLLPLVVVVVCYAGVVRELAKGPHTHNPCRVRARRLNVLILVVFVVCFLPYHILRILRVDTRMKPESSCMLVRWVHTAYIVSRPIAGLNTFFNLALYTLAGDKFQQAFLSVFPWGSWWTKFRTHLKLSLAVVSKPSNTASAERPAATDMA
ncbi:2-oxoglutarate receptor 1-like [Oncorhynchus mykiss]|uniref:G-protein coupled receptors family 1 profile domain-containing protein n=1 Tax=Oncorhynchus mykiss TaxID=8022 RepID=A0A8C7TWT5_ONCMY|nr:2-oxoglutarate receptor 1-like [Oncorhynchus mykiss]XP_036838729.1 2-oxoglutarate receptor 1-like [Oncorhynchus mykiss]